MHLKPVYSVLAIAILHATLCFVACACRPSGEFYRIETGLPATSSATPLPDGTVHIWYISALGDLRAPPTSYADVIDGSGEIEYHPSWDGEVMFKIYADGFLPTPNSVHVHEDAKIIYLTVTPRP